MMAPFKLDRKWKITELILFNLYVFFHNGEAAYYAKACAQIDALGAVVLASK
jgi:hypothetical protein